MAAVVSLARRISCSCCWLLLLDIVLLDLFGNNVNHLQADDGDRMTLVEDGFGYITVEWKLGFLGDRQSELEARTICNDESSSQQPSDFNFAAAERLHGIIDQRRPLFGSPTRSSSQELFPGDRITFEFTELVFCAALHVFKWLQKSQQSPHPWCFDNAINNNLLVVCEDHSISVAFDYSVNYSDLLGCDSHCEANQCCWSQWQSSREELHSSSDTRQRRFWFLFCFVPPWHGYSL